MKVDTTKVIFVRKNVIEYTGKNKSSQNSNACERQKIRKKTIFQQMQFALDYSFILK